jgi:hypothetical protein
MAETVDLCPVNVDGRVVYVAPPQLTTEAKGAWVAVLLVLAALALVALAGKEPRR